MVPYALGQKVIFERDKGPKLSEFNKDVFLSQEENEFNSKPKQV